MAQTKCRKCGKAIDFIRMRSGKYMPVDPTGLYCTRDERGPITVITRFGETVRVSEVFKGEAGTLIGYIPHWQSCKGAKEIKREYAQRRERTGGTRRGRGDERQAQPPKPEPPTHEQLTLFGGMR